MRIRFLCIRIQNKSYKINFDRILMIDEKSRRFMEIYSNLPVKTRREIVAVIDGEPISWAIAYKEIQNNTELGNKIIKKMEELKIL